MTTLAPLTIRQGDTFTRVLTVTGDDGAALDLTSCTVRFNARYPGATDLAIDPAPTLTLTDAANGVATLTIAAAVTADLNPRATLVYEIEIEDASGNVTTPIEGLCYVSSDIG